MKRSFLSKYRVIKPDFDQICIFPMNFGRDAPKTRWNHIFCRNMGSLSQISTKYVNFLWILVEMHPIQDETLILVVWENYHYNVTAMWNKIDFFFVMLCHAQGGEYLHICYEQQKNAFNTKSRSREWHNTNVWQTYRLTIRIPLTWCHHVSWQITASLSLPAHSA